jgi:DNA-binding transcriptional ArsR family regulator
MPQNKSSSIRRPERLARLFQAMADANRLRILCRIFATRNACVSDIADYLGLSVAVTSYHLKALAEQGLLKPQRDGKRVCYLPAHTALYADMKKLICKHG